ncbi:MAG TPA: glycosyltransferase 87 family protein [Acidobacteriaceae bacterium]|nr:glycosyltransferase 87 family protein [Acidobacteriaceae bacterium]
MDLRAFYAAGTVLRSGHGAQLYDYDYQAQVQNAVVGPRANALPFLYPSFAALPFVPLSLLRYRAAFFVWLGLNLGLLVLDAFLLRPWLPYFAERSWIALPAFYGCLFGVSVALLQGQISFLLLVVYCGAWVLLRQKRPFLAGLLLSLGLMKFQIAIPVLVLFLLWKQWRVVSGFLAGAAALAVVSIALVGRTGVSVYFHAMSNMTRQTAFHAAAAKVHYGMFPVDMPNLHGLTFGLTHGASWGLALNIALCCIVMVFAARQKASLSIALPAAMLVSYHMQPHDLTLLLLPLSFELDALLRRVRRNNSAYDLALRWSLLLLILPLAAVVMTASMNYLVSLAVCAVMLIAARMKTEDMAAASA